MRTSARGFTLIEMIVVIAIIGLIASVLLVSLSSARAKGRDTRRVSDIRSIQAALEQYYQACSVYPRVLSALSGSTCTNGPNTGASLNVPMPNVPQDPSGGSYKYVTMNDRAIGQANINCDQDYHLGATLEKPSDVLNNDSNAPAMTTSLSIVVNTCGPTSPCNITTTHIVCGGATDFNGQFAACGGTSGSNQCYDIRTCTVTPNTYTFVCK